MVAPTPACAKRTPEAGGAARTGGCCSSEDSLLLCLSLVFFSPSLPPCLVFSEVPMDECTYSSQPGWILVSRQRSSTR